MREVAWPEGGLPRAEFVERVRAMGDAHYRALPWRHLDDAYAVLVSEVMLQQTQVTRVEKFWCRFLGAFPTIDALAAASTSDVLERWQGLGYNRRALALKKAAEVCAARYAGHLPRAYEELVALPGIGPATAAGVRAFAWQLPGVYLETNVRAVFLHDLFPHDEKVPDRMLIPLVEATCPPAPGGALPGGASSDALPDDAPSDALSSPRSWYYALLDYGAHLKATGANPTRKSAHYKRQSAFEGSRRQKRSWIVRRVLAADADEGVRADEVHAELDAAERASGRDGVDEATFASIIDDLLSEGFFKRAGDVLVP
ncbi:MULTISPECIES: adenine glycosylase [unclassified Adlercreutzia]|uniref:adenine glycosylase n=1 Tax=unclassified Adlercreutzia TaxID=2636013 RepID=UPI0013EDE6F4|nr:MULTISPECIES: adenine glycosylase [unclassified Adlercreutzia]